MSSASNIIPFLVQNSLFQNLNGDQLMEVAALATEKSCSVGEAIIEEGHKAEFFYIIMKGIVDVTKKDPNSDSDFTVATLKKGEIIGEVGLLTDEDRIATVRISTPTTLIQFSIQDFQKKLSADTFSIVSKNIFKILIERISYSYNNEIVLLKSSRENAKKRNFYQVLGIIILIIFLLQIGSMFYYFVISKHFCEAAQDSMVIKGSLI